MNLHKQLVQRPSCDLQTRTEVSKYHNTHMHSAW